MLGGKGRSLIMMGSIFLTAGFSFTNYYLILSALFMIFATFVSLPGFDSSLNIEELKVKRVSASNKIFEDDFFHVKVVIENTGGTKFDFIDILMSFRPMHSEFLSVKTSSAHGSIRIKRLNFHIFYNPKSGGNIVLDRLILLFEIG